MELLLLLSRVSPEASTVEKAQNIINSSVNWDLFTALSLKHGTSAIIYKNLYRLQNVPEHIIKKYKGIYNNLLRKNILMISELDRIIDGLNRKNIEVISLKGAATSEKIFGDIGIYPSGDIDMLVKVEDVDKVREFLENDGYSLNDAGFEKYKGYYLKEQYHISLTKDMYTVEPHWNLFMRYFNSAPEFWWEESNSVLSGGRQYMFLSPERNILYGSFRLFSQAFNYLRFLVMVAEMIRYYRKEIDWNKLFIYADRFQFQHVLAVVLRLSNELLGAPVPKELIELKRFRTRLLYKYAGRILMQEKNVNNNFNVRYKILLTLLSTDFSRAFRIFSRRIFPSKGEIVARYGIPEGSYKMIIYYLLNPILILTRKDLP